MKTMLIGIMVTLGGLSGCMVYKGTNDSHMVVIIGIIMTAYGAFKYFLDGDEE